MSATASRIAPAAKTPHFDHMSPRLSQRAKLLGVGRVLLSVTAATALWWAVAATEVVEPVFLPTPAAVADALVNASSCTPVSDSEISCGVSGYFLWEHVMASLARVAAGLVGGCFAGAFLAFVMSETRVVRTLVGPYLTFFRALPPLGYLGLLIVWFGIGDTSKLALLFLAAFPPVTVATLGALDGMRRDHLLVAMALGASRRQRLFHVLAPAALPGLLSGVRIAAGFTWTTVVAAELNNGVPGIGGLAYLAGTRLDTALTIGCIVVIGLLAIAIDAVLAIPARRVSHWEKYA